MSAWEATGHPDLSVTEAASIYEALLDASAQNITGSKKMADGARPSLLYFACGFFPALRLVPTMWH